MSDLIPASGTGPYFSDDFNRANSAAMGNGWVEYKEYFEILSNEVNAPVASPNIAAAQQEGVAAAGEMFVQCDLKVNAGSGFPKVGVRMASSSAGPSGIFDDGYVLRCNARDNRAQLIRFLSTAQVVLDNPVVTLNAATYYPTQLYCADGLQEGWINGQTVSAADTSHDGANSRYGGIVGQSSSGTVAQQYDNFLWMPSVFITVSGLSVGQKAKVLNSGASVVAQATSSGGTAIIDCSMFGGATEVVPFAGWDALIVTESDDTEVARYDAAGIYPGYTYTLSGGEGSTGQPSIRDRLPNSRRRSAATLPFGFLRGNLQLVGA